MVALRLEDVGAQYGRHRVFSEITTSDITGGALTAVIGPNAAGKSTLFKRIAGLLKGDGVVHVSGEESLRPICYMPQDTGANAVLTVYESILLASKQGSGWKVADNELVEIDRVLHACASTTSRFAISGNCRWPASVGGNCPGLGPQAGNHADGRAHFGT